MQAFVKERDLVLKKHIEKDTVCMAVILVMYLKVASSLTET